MKSTLLYTANNVYIIIILFPLFSLSIISIRTYCEKPVCIDVVGSTILLYKYVFVFCCCFFHSNFRSDEISVRKPIICEMWKKKNNNNNSTTMMTKYWRLKIKNETHLKWNQVEKKMSVLCVFGKFYIQNSI